MSLENYVITIDRKMGSKGRTIGQKVAAHFGFYFVDKDIVKRAAEILHISPEKLRGVDEKAVSIWAYLMQTSDYDAPNMPLYNHMPTGREVFEAETRIIEKVAKDTSCVIVGRCANAIFKDEVKHIGFFLHGSNDFRVVNAAEYLGISIEDAVNSMSKFDKERGRYYSTYAGYNWTDVSNYDLAIDVSKVGVDKAAEILIRYIEDRFPELAKK